MLDVYDPNFKRDLEEKTKERLAESKALMPSYEAQGHIEQPKAEPQQHFYIDKYATDDRAHMDNSKRILPNSRALSKVGPTGQLVKLEQTQFPLHPNDVPKRLKVCKFRDDEL